MSRTEEYLDSLLNTVSPERKAETDKKRRRTSADFIRDFEEELDDTDIEDVISEFEGEPESLESFEQSGDSFFNELEGIVNTAKESSAGSKPQESEEPELEVNTLGDDSWTEAPKSDTDENPAPKSEVSEDEQELMDVLSHTPSEEEISNLAGVGESIQEDTEGSEEAEAEDFNETDKKAGKKKKEKKGRKEKKEKQGFFAKLSTVLFGTDDDETLEEGRSSDAGDGQKEAEKEVPKKKEKKKKEKKPKEKKAKEKKPKEKKPKKEKKEKKPKEVDLSPPLPKVPVILIFIMCLSVMIFVVLSSNLLGYSMSINESKKLYAAGDYVGAYEKIAGLEPKEGDAEFAEKIFLLAQIQEKVTNGDGLYRSKKYEMALDSYICALGRYDANYQKATDDSLKQELDRLAEKITKQLNDVFGVNAKTAREIYGLSDRAEYTQRVYAIVKTLGFTE